MPPRFGGAPKCPRCEKSVYMAEQVIGPGGPWHNYCLTCKECNKRLDSTTLTEKDNEAYCKTCYGRKWGPKGYGFAGGAAFLSTESKMPSEILKSNYDESNTIRSSPPSLPKREIMTSQSPNLTKREIVTSESPVYQTPPSLPSRPQLPTRPVINEATKPNMNANHTTESTGGYIRNHTSYVPRKFNFQSQQDVCSGCGKVVYAAELALGAGNKYHKACLKCSHCGKRLDSSNMVDRDFDLYCRGCYSKLFGPKGYGYGNLLTPEGATR